jgi:hypothetical protein
MQRRWPGPRKARQVNALGGKATAVLWGQLLPGPGIGKQPRVKGASTRPERRVLRDDGIHLAESEGRVFVGGGDVAAIPPPRRRARGAQTALRNGRKRRCFGRDNKGEERQARETCAICALHLIKRWAGAWLRGWRLLRQLLFGERTDVVHHVPHLGGFHATRFAGHLALAVGDDGIDFSVGQSFQGRRVTVIAKCQIHGYG